MGPSTIVHRPPNSDKLIFCLEDLLFLPVTSGAKDIIVQADVWLFNSCPAFSNASITHFLLNLQLVSIKALCSLCIQIKEVGDILLNRHTCYYRPVLGNLNTCTNLLNGAITKVIKMRCIRRLA